MIKLHGKKYMRIGSVWHFYYPLKNGIEWHELLNWCIKRELKAAEQCLHTDTATPTDAGESS